jgi:hypothetical protein
MTVKFSFFSKEESLLGILIRKYNACNSKDEENRLIIKSYYNVSIGLFFCVLTLKIYTGEKVHLQ